MTLWTILRSTVACTAVIALAACEQSVSPVQPSAVASHPLSQPAALISPNQATAIANAIGNCKGPVLGILPSLLGAGTLVTVQDEDNVFAFQLSSAGHTSCHTIEYNDIDNSDSLSCGDEVTGVDALDCPFD